MSDQCGGPSDLKSPTIHVLETVQAPLVTQPDAGDSIDATPTNDTPANEKIGSTYELLEFIIVLLPPKAIFAFKRVNSTWLGVINRSEHIRKQMGIRASGPAIDFVDTRAWLYRTAGLQLTRILPVYQQDRPQIQDGAKPGLPIRARISARHGSGFHFDSRPDIDMDISVTLKFGNVNRQGGSWRDVLLTSPPIKAVRLGINPNAGLFASNYSRVTGAEEGVTLGDVYDAHEDLRTQYFRDLSIRLGPEAIFGTFFIEQKNLGACGKVSPATMETDYSLRPGSCECGSHHLLKEFARELYEDGPKVTPV